MNPISHFLAGWLVANAAGLGRADRAIVTAAAVVPDLDGAGLIADLISGDTSGGYFWYTRFHHLLAHNLLFGLLVAGAAFAAARRRWATALLALLAFHVHLLGDFVGSKGPGDSYWTIPYLWPFSAREWSWEGQWMLNAWPNVLITAIALAATLYLAWRRGFSPVGIFSERADRTFVAALRGRFGSPAHEGTEPGR
jgi:inner membrane protein